MRYAANRHVSIFGHIAPEGQVEPFVDANLTVHVQDVTLADARARVVATYTQEGVNYEALFSGYITFQFVDLPLEIGARYTLRAHIDVDGDGEVSEGDLISMQSFPVSVLEPAAKITVLVRQVM